MLFLVFWSVMLISGIIDVATRHVPDYPNAVTGFPNVGQVGLYAIFPSILVLLNVVHLLMADRLHRSISGALITVQLVLVFAFLMLSGGGI